MKLRNKKTGEIIDLDVANIKAQFGGISIIPLPIKLNGEEYVYTSLASLNEDWEDYEEQGAYYCITALGNVGCGLIKNKTREYLASLEHIGNYFKTEEEAEKAVEKLKALKRLKDKGFKFEGWSEDYLDEGQSVIKFDVSAPIGYETDNAKDLDLLFGE